MYILKRILFTTILLVATFIAPWWVTFIASLLGIFYFNSYYEAIAVGALFDILYGVSATSSFGYGIVGFVTITILFLVIKRIKQELR